jgi:hypothetical protein
MTPEPRLDEKDLAAHYPGSVRLVEAALSEGMVRRDHRSRIAGTATLAPMRSAWGYCACGQRKCRSVRAFPPTTRQP